MSSPTKPWLNAWRATRTSGWLTPKDTSVVTWPCPARRSPEATSLDEAYAVEFSRGDEATMYCGERVRQRYRRNLRLSLSHGLLRFDSKQISARVGPSRRLHCCFVASNSWLLGTLGGHSPFRLDLVG